MTKQEIGMEVIGGIGAVSVLYAYISVSTRRVEGDSLHYQFFNILGAFALMIYTYIHQAYFSFIVNAIWVVMAFVSLGIRWRKPKE